MNGRATRLIVAGRKKAIAACRSDFVVLDGNAQSLRTAVPSVALDVK